MPYRLNVAKLREIAAEHGDTSDYKIYKRAGISKSGMSRLINQHVEPTVSSLKRLSLTYGVGLEELIEELDEELAVAS